MLSLYLTILSTAAVEDMHPSYSSLSSTSVGGGGVSTPSALLPFPAPLALSGLALAWSGEATLRGMRGILEN